ncbi:phosphotransferase enzyme family protein [Pseudactinotalea sp. Z1739]|uniref:phosphotransferase enzyme family protein n=1 Tax=Pseudactinotalea sp. Z1739 TaxID=3413028 RepID=UPI003C7A8810
MCTVEPTVLARTFGLVEVHADSLSPWACVHRARTADGRDVVVKRTAPSARRAEAMARWTRALVHEGVPVVTPVELALANPAQVQDDWCVVYPFLTGRAYAAQDLGDVRAAGSLLGRIHATPLDTSVLQALRPYAWPGTTRAEVETDLATLGTRLPAMLGPRAGEHALGAVTALADRWWQESFPMLRSADTTLPRAGVSSDFKAANLIYAPPVLVDPDNGGLEPRLFDLAMAVVLFHHESPSAPGRLFTETEWQAFYAGYAEHVTLTPAERDLWPAALDHMFWEEGTWVLEDNDDDAWADPRQGAYLRDLATINPARFSLPH